MDEDDWQLVIYSISMTGFLETSIHYPANSEVKSDLERYWIVISAYRHDKTGLKILLLHPSGLQIQQGRFFPLLSQFRPSLNIS